MIAEAFSESDAGNVERVRAVAPRIPILRFERRIDAWRTLDGSPADPPEGDVLVVSSVGSPARLERFLAASGVRVARHLAFPDHAAWPIDIVSRYVTIEDPEGRLDAIVVTDKDAPRAKAVGDWGRPVLVVSSRLVAVDDPAPLLGAIPALPLATPAATTPPGTPPASVAGAGPIG